MPRLAALPTRKVWPPEPTPCPALSNGVHATNGEGRGWACGTPLPSDCDHNVIDPHSKKCQDCGQPVSDELADAASEARAAQMYRAR